MTGWIIDLVNNKLSGQDSSDSEFAVPRGSMRSLVVNAALLDASIITMAMAVIVFGIFKLCIESAYLLLVCAKLLFLLWLFGIWQFV